MISVIIPAYNCEAYLREAVESALAQSGVDMEIWIVDDCSTDGTPALARELEREDSRIRVLSNAENLGVAKSRNRALELAEGAYIAFLDADDAWQPDKLRRQLTFLEDRGLDICYTAYSFMDRSGRPIRSVYHVPQRLTAKTLLRENVIGLSTVLLRRDAAGEVRMRGDYAHEDYVFWLELMGNGCTAGGLDIPLTRYRISDSNRSGDKKKAAANRWKIYRRFLGMGRLQALGWFVQYAVRGSRKHLFKVNRDRASR